jgi:OmpA-OmpF porin, OOP family
MFANRIFWFILLLVWMAGSTWWHVCKIKFLCGDDAPSGMTAGLARSALTIADGNLFRLELPGGFDFARSGADPNVSRFETSLDSLALYLQNNPGRALTITGYYGADETNNTSFENLGLGRAEVFKQLLVQKGVPPASLLTKGELLGKPTYNANRDSLYGGLGFSFGAEFAAPVATSLATADTSTVISTTTVTTEQQLAEKQTFESVFKPIDLYFPTGKSDYIHTDDTDRFFAEAAKYLPEHKDKKLLLTGYTDNEGSEESNLALSRKRAAAVRKQLEKVGITAAQVTVKAKGEADPKASNDTEEGRKANRRVTVVVE